MNLLQAIILGIVQGLTEFLPVSSSGHLVIFQHLFGLQEPALVFDIGVHIGTLVAVIIFFRREINAIIMAVMRFAGAALKREATLKEIRTDPMLNLALFIVVGSVPTAILGLLFRRVADTLFSSMMVVGISLIITGILLASTKWIKKEGFTLERFPLPRGLVIGLIQGLAIIPGISRSGSTIATGILLGLDRETAAKFSFLLSIPAVTGAGLLGVKDLLSGSDFSITLILVGSVVSGIVGYGALKLLVYIVKQGRMHFFAPYCILAGLLALGL
jgi:undecaprenyl-diphosphatase